jgi:hypothetical protein
MIRRELSKVAVLGLALSSALAQAVTAIPDDAGWSGYLNIGVGAGSSESNMLAGISSVDLGDEQVSGLDQSPDDEDIVLPALQFEIAYTFNGMGTQLYLSNQVDDHLNFDLDTTLETHLGARQDVGEIGVVDFSLAASAIPTDVWKDPYLVNEDRGDTERTSNGIHIVWDSIFGSPFKFAWSSREIEIDDERSGEAGNLGLTSREQLSLRRTGDFDRVDLNYSWKINDRHTLVPGIGYLDYDLDGAAMAEDGLVVQLKHSYEKNRWRVVSKVFYEDLESDEVNPIYGKERELETIGGIMTVFYTKPLGLKDWTANAGVAYYDGDSNIDFYDSSFGLVSIGMLYRFD